MERMDKWRDNVFLAQEPEGTGPRLGISPSYEDYCAQASLGILSNIQLKRMQPEKRKALKDLNTNARFAKGGFQTAKQKWITLYQQDH